LGADVSKPPIMLSFPSQVQTPSKAQYQVANKMKNLRRAFVG
jgi:hypothetical protein